MKFAFGPETHPLPGYTIKRAIDRGGFGEVYYALSDSGKEVALKLLRDNPDIELRGVSQCLNLKHPNLVTIFDVRTDEEGDSWVIMEYISGESLEAVLTRDTEGLPYDEVLHWLAGAADGIAHLHERGIVHRDLKPANIFHDQGIVKIGDVGLSKFMSPSRRSAQTESVGTVHYMAPEVARGKYGRELDVYSLAVIAYEMMTGRVPFDGESTAEILMKHLTARPDLSAVAATFRPVLERALEKDPHRRTPTIRQFMDEFHQAYREKRGALHATYGMPGTIHSGTNGVSWTKSCENRGAQASAAEARRRAAGAVDTWRRANSTDRGAVAQRDPSHQHDRHSRRGKDKFWFWVAAVIGVLFLLRMSSAGGVRGPIPSRGFFLLAVLGGVAYITYIVVSKVVSSLLTPNPYPGVALPARGGGGGSGTVPQGDLRVNPVPTPGANLQVRPIPNPAPKVSRHVWYGPNTIRPISLATRWQDIFTSMTWATFWTLVCSAGITLGLDALGLARFAQLPGQLELFGFTTLVAAWIIIPLIKLMEGTSLPWPRRRLMLGVAGAGVGAVAWWLGTIQLVTRKLPQAGPVRHGIFRRIGDWDLIASDQMPTLAGCMVFFAVLFALRRWCDQGDSFRLKQFRWMSWGFTGVVAWAITMAFSFPSTWALGWGLALSAVVQLSTGWIVPHERGDLILAERNRVLPQPATDPAAPHTSGAET